MFMALRDADSALPVIQRQKIRLTDSRTTVLAVIDSLKLKRPILVGHSIAGAELSAVANSYIQTEWHEPDLS